MSCGVGCKWGLYSALLWLWCRPAATALIRSLAWESPYAMGAAQEMTKRQKKERGKSYQTFLLDRTSYRCFHVIINLEVLMFCFLVPLSHLYFDTVSAGNVAQHILPGLSKQSRAKNVWLLSSYWTISVYFIFNSCFSQQNSSVLRCVPEWMNMLRVS